MTNSPNGIPNTNTLTYTIRAENETSIDLPEGFGQSVLVIDFTPEGFIFKGGGKICC